MLNRALFNDLGLIQTERNRAKSLKSLPAGTKQVQLIRRAPGAFRFAITAGAALRSASCTPGLQLDDFLKAIFQRFTGSSNFTPAGSNASGAYSPPAQVSNDSCSGCPGSAIAARNSW